MPSYFLASRRDLLKSFCYYEVAGYSFIFDLHTWIVESVFSSNNCKKKRISKKTSNFSCDYVPSFIQKLYTLPLTAGSEHFRKLWILCKPVMCRHDILKGIFDVLKEGFYSLSLQSRKRNELIIRVWCISNRKTVAKQSNQHILLKCQRCLRLPSVPPDFCPCMWFAIWGACTLLLLKWLEINRI